MPTKAKLIFLAVGFLIVACNPPPYRNKYGENNFYPQDFRSDVAYLVLEWAERKPHIMASGYLADQVKGIFYTAKHFTDDFGALGPDYCKVFLNGKVYTAKLMKVSPIRDTALIRISSYFSPDELPKPSPVSPSEPKIGDSLYVQGMHPHSYQIREENESEGFPDKIIPIFETYYGQVMKDKSRESQVVFDNLEGKRVKPDPDSIRKDRWLSDEQKKILLEYENSLYIKILVVRDHKFSFGGLSGGVALNSNKEIVGAITAQNPLRFEYDEHGFFFIPGEGPVEIADIKKQLFDTIYVTPIWAVKDLQRFIEEAK